MLKYLNKYGAMTIELKPRTLYVKNFDVRSMVFFLVSSNEFSDFFKTFLSALRITQSVDNEMNLQQNSVSATIFNPTIVLAANM